MSKKYKLEKPFFYKGHLCYSLKNKDGKYDTVRSDKLTWVTFRDSDLNPIDESWDLKHIDGDWKNCRLDNLEKIK